MKALNYDLWIDYISLQVMLIGFILEIFIQYYTIFNQINDLILFEAYACLFAWVYCQVKKPNLKPQTLACYELRFYPSPKMYLSLDISVMSGWAE